MSSIDTSKEPSSRGEAAYPAAPWRLRGYGFQTLRLIDIAAARAFVPSGVQIVPVLPGKTLGSIYFASYEEGSTLVYHEIVIAAGLIWAGNRLGVALPRLYVDNPASYAGGHTIWGAPKEMAEFTVDRTSGETVVSVCQEGQEVMSLRFGAPGRTIPGWVPLPSFGVRGDELLFYIPRVRSGVTMVRTNISLSAGSPFLPLHLDGSSLGLAYPNLDLLAPAAKSVGRIRA
jgi:acetoacetate decarboxylase